MKESKKLVAEALGTFIFFTIGAGAIVSDAVFRTGIGLVGVALAHGVALALVVSAFGRISGAHVNPAVTVGLWIGKKIDAMLAAKYIVAQLVGGTAAGLVLGWIFPDGAALAKLGTPQVSFEVGALTAIGVEALLTFFLVIMVYATAVDPKAPSIAGFGIGLMVFLDILVGGPLTGGAMNPARTFGPALATTIFGGGASVWTQHYVYWIGPCLGGAAAGLLYTNFLSSEKA